MALTVRRIGDKIALVVGIAVAAGTVLTQCGVFDARKARHWSHACVTVAMRPDQGAQPDDFGLSLSQFRAAAWTVCMRENGYTCPPPRGEIAAPSCRQSGSSASADNPFDR
ncbi:MAG TPA: hypothetical protein VHC63_13410 [Acidimicrobiales bacterium]|nr:hypothetical protein [Acidimicrobiales bacterium]